MDTPSPRASSPRRIRLALAALAVALTLPAAVAPATQAQRTPPPAPHESARERGAGERHGSLPGLTDEQREAMRAIRLEAAERALPIQNQLREKRARLRTLSTAEPVDERAAMAVLDDIGDLQSQLMRIRWESGQAVRGLLTDEQRILLDQRQSKGMKGRSSAGHRGQGRAGAPGAGPRHERTVGKSGPQGNGPAGGPGRGRQGGGWNR
jgi:Spy/CpxP family protein refolding chaperone